MALTFTPKPNSESLPEFKLPGIDGKIYESSKMNTGNPLLIMFICNHCPYVKAIEDRLIQLGHDLEKLGVQVYAICSNDASEYPEDSFENIKKRAKEKEYPFTYLYDKTQEVAHAFGAVCTPDFFLYSKNLKLSYRGRLDDSWKDASKVNKRELYEAAKLLSEGKQAPQVQTPSMGCSIKWKS
jgi:peroxiredoxin